MRVILLFLILQSILYANPSLGYWMTQEGKNGKEAIVLIEKDKDRDTYSGKIKYIATVDENFDIISYTNKDEIIDFTLIKDLEKTDENIYKNGTIIDPKTSNEYHASAKIKGDKFILRGSLDPCGILGAKRVWKRIDKSYLKNYGDEKL
ncbi:MULTISPECIES: DUF2147 domain-containing protein [Fusobacterium]|jgi:uncharacterized protein (DUF2147 family)|uniref:DUF2147 domain-containing protein n=1 Tax=Fusobacterium hominis TaxID=2764326 RepID=A0A7G9GVQ5_9FUSO|nr:MULTISPECIES: DUF2147 domain-containing protein [Fusobacterium]QNM14887.1 DUF2147 domain-containing protein [Fusobacterium hominis]